MLEELLQTAKDKETHLATFNPADEDEESEYWYLRYDLSQLYSQIAESYSVPEQRLLAAEYYYKSYELTRNNEAAIKLEALGFKNRTEIKSDNTFWCAHTQHRIAKKYKKSCDIRAIPLLLRSAMQGNIEANSDAISFINSLFQNRRPNAAANRKAAYQKLIRHYRKIIKKYDSELAKKYLEDIYYSVVKMETSPEDIIEYRIEACKYQLAAAMIKFTLYRKEHPEDQDARYHFAIALTAPQCFKNYSLLIQIFHENPSALIKRISRDPLFDAATKKEVLENLFTEKNTPQSAEKQSEIEYHIGDYYHDQFSEWCVSFVNNGRTVEEKAVIEDEFQKAEQVKIDEILPHLMLVSHQSPFYKDAADLITLLRSTMRGESYQDLCFTFFTQRNLPHPVATADAELDAQVKRLRLTGGDDEATITQNTGFK